MWMVTFLSYNKKAKNMNIIINNIIVNKSKYSNKCGALRDLVPCAQFKKRQKHPLLKVTLLVGVFHVF